MVGFVRRLQCIAIPFDFAEPVYQRNWQKGLPAEDIPIVRSHI